MEGKGLGNVSGTVNWHVDGRKQAADAPAQKKKQAPPGQHAVAAYELACGALNRAKLSYQETPDKSMGDAITALTAAIRSMTH